MRSRLLASLLLFAGIVLLGIGVAGSAPLASEDSWRPVPPPSIAARIELTLGGLLIAAGVISSLNALSGGDRTRASRDLTSRARTH